MVSRPLHQPIENKAVAVRCVRSYCCNTAPKCVQQDGANGDLIIYIKCCGSITCGNLLNPVEESDTEDEL